MRIHLVSANSKNKFGMEYFVSKVFKKLGHEIIETDYRTMSKEEVSTRIRFITDCDFLLMIKGERISPDDLFACRIPKILWMQDSVQANREANFVIQTKSWVFDLVYGFDDHELPFYQKFNKNVKWLPLASDSDTHFKMNTDKTIDVGFVGNMNNNRIEMINNLLSYNIPVELFYTKEKYCDIVNKIRINLNVGIGFSGIQQRVFEILSMGGFLFTNRLKGGTELFKNEEHLVYFDDYNHLVRLIYDYIDNPHKRYDIAENGRIEVLKNHTYENRVQQIINDFINL